MEVGAICSLPDAPYETAAAADEWMPVGSDSWRVENDNLPQLCESGFG